MFHGVPNVDRVAWPTTERWLERPLQAGLVVVRWALLKCGFGYRMPDVRMSREWLKEHEQQESKHPDDV